MVEYSSRLLDRTFGALADPTRRRILAQLAKGEECVTESGAAARDVAGGGVEAFDRFGEGGAGEAAPAGAGAFVGVGGEADAGGAGVDQPVSEILGGEPGSVRKIFGQTTNEGNRT